MSNSDGDDICNYEYQTIKDIILWSPPVESQLLWAQHLRYILTKNNNGAPRGWLRNLIRPIGTHIGKQLTTSEKELVRHLYTILQLTHWEQGLCNFLTHVMAVSRSTIYRCLPSSVYKGDSQHLESSPKQSRKRTGGESFTREKEKCKKLASIATPEKRDLKTYPGKSESFAKGGSLDGSVLSRVKSFVPGNTKSLVQEPKVLDTHKADDQDLHSTEFSKQMVTKCTQTKREVHKKRRRQTVLKINKRESSIKILVDDRDVEKAKPAFISLYEELDEKQEETIRTSANKIGSIIAIICDNNPMTAARTLAKVLTLETYHLVKKLFDNKYMSAEKKIVSGIQSFVADHCNLPDGGTRPAAIQNAIDALLLAVVWDVGNGERMGREVARTIGVYKDTINENIHRATEMKETGERFKPRQRKMRKDNVQEAAYTYIQKWQHNDNNTRIDTNTWKEQKSMNPFTNEEQRCSRRVWSVIGAERNFKLFLESQEYTEFKNITNDVNGTIGLTTFQKYLCPCTKEPTGESCVDSLISEMQHLMAALKEGLSKLTEAEIKIISDISGYDGLLNALQKGRAVEMIEACCCPRREQTEFKINDYHPVPKLLHVKCGDGTCERCGFERRFGGIFTHEILTRSELLLKVYVWEKAKRQGIDKSNKQNTQLELTEKEMKLKEAVALFQTRIQECLPHVFKIEWANAVRAFDINNVGQNNIVIMTDFAATLDLKAIETVNSSIDAHAFLDNFIVISNRRDAIVRFRNRRNGAEEEKVLSINDCDVLQYFGSTMSKGKKNDYVTHNACLQEIIRRYIKEFEERQQKLTFVIVWTDNCTNQYKCRQNFAGIVKTEKVLGILVVHCFAVKDNFKGVWDGAGKVAKNFLWRREQEKTRSANALECFVNTKNEEFEFDDRQKWKRYEETNDPYLLQKNTFTYTRRVVGLVVDTEAEYNQYSAMYPGCIVHANRQKVLDFKKALKDTKKLSQVAFCKATRRDNEGENEVFLNLQDFPCRCGQCRNHFFDEDEVVECPFKTITNTRNRNRSEYINDGNSSSNEGIAGDAAMGPP